MRRERRNVDLVIFADQRQAGVAQGAAAMFTVDRPLVVNFVRRIR
jgi:hypothetical protein